jgi:amino acid transporter
MENVMSVGLFYTPLYAFVEGRRDATAMAAHGSFNDSWTGFIYSHATVAIVIGVAFTALVFFKPKQAVKLAMTVVIIGIVVYLIFFLVDLTSTGFDEATKLTGRPQIKLN